VLQRLATLFEVEEKNPKQKEKKLSLRSSETRGRLWLKRAAALDSIPNRQRRRLEIPPTPTKQTTSFFLIVAESRFQLFTFHSAALAFWPGASVGFSGPHRSRLCRLLPEFRAAFCGPPNWQNGLTARRTGPVARKSRAILFLE
jgi:hypothetical protein